MNQMFIDKFPDRVPVIIKKAINCNKLIELDNCKYLIPKTLMVTDLIYIIRNKLKKTDNKEAIFIFVGDEMSATLVPGNKNLGEIFDEHRSKDNILYVTYAIENTFG